MPNPGGGDGVEHGGIAEPKGGCPTVVAASGFGQKQRTRSAGLTTNPPIGRKFGRGNVYLYMGGIVGTKSFPDNGDFRRFGLAPNSS